MRPNRGCGCLVLVLAVLNFFIVISLLWGIVGGSVENVGMSLLMLVLFSANIAVCVMLGLMAVRTRGPGMGQTGGAAGDAEGEEPEADEDGGQQ